MEGNVRELLLPTRGHLESASAVTHLWSALGFLGYAVARAAMVDLSTTRGLFLVLAAFFSSATFFASTFYHITTPDDRWAEVGRQADFVAIYVGVAVAFTSDLCIVTREFSNVPLVAILDLPLAVLCVALFFGYRRWVLPGDATLVEEFQCSRIGLYAFKSPTPRTRLTWGFLAVTDAGTPTSTPPPSDRPPRSRSHCLVLCSRRSSSGTSAPPL